MNNVPKASNRLEHGAYRVINHGISALPVELGARGAEIVENLGTHPGVMRELEEQAKYQIMVCECGFAYLKGLIDNKTNPWEAQNGQPAPILRMLGSWSNGAVRTLAQLAALRGDKDVVDLAAVITRAREAAEDVAHG